MRAELGSTTLPQHHQDTGKVLAMTRMTNAVLFGAAALLALAVGAVSAQEPATAEMRSLDEQVQEIKTDVLGIAAELNRLEEKLLYPSNTHLEIGRAHV